MISLKATTATTFLLWTSTCLYAHGGIVPYPTQQDLKRSGTTCFDVDTRFDIVKENHHSVVAWYQEPAKAFNPLDAQPFAKLQSLFPTLTSGKMIYGLTFTASDCSLKDDELTFANHCTTGLSVSLTLLLVSSDYDARDESTHHISKAVIPDVTIEFETAVSRMATGGVNSSEMISTISNIVPMAIISFSTPINGVTESVLVGGSLLDGVFPADQAKCVRN